VRFPSKELLENVSDIEQLLTNLSIVDSSRWVATSFIYESMHAILTGSKAKELSS
jgi:hypothetical protein